MNGKRSLIRWGLRVLFWKINLCSSGLRLSELPRCRERPQTAIRCLEWLGWLKCLTIGLDAALSLLSTSRRCSRSFFLLDGNNIPFSSGKKQDQKTIFDFLLKHDFLVRIHLFKLNHLFPYFCDFSPKQHMFYCCFGN